MLSFASVIFFSKCSPLYLYCNDVDHIIFTGVIEKMKDGAVIYRDVFDHKGPYWYFFYYFLQILTPKSVFSIFVFDILFKSAFLYYLYKTVNFLVSDVRKSCFLTCIFGFFTIVSPISNSAKTDEFALPFAMYAIYILVRYMGTRIPMRIYFVIGLHMGLWFWSKFTILLFYLGCFVFLIFDRSKDLWKGTLVVVSGMLVTTIPVMIYFVLNNALDSLWEVYFCANLFNYSNMMSFGEKIHANIVVWLSVSMGYLIILVLYALLVSRKISRQEVFFDIFKKNKHLFFMLAIVYFFSTVPIMLVASPSYRNYFAQAGGVVSLFFVLLFYYSFTDSRFDDVMVKFERKSVCVLSMVSFVVFSFVVGFLGWVSVYAPISFIFESDLSDDPHYAVAEYIRSHGGSNLLVYGGLDDGFNDILDYDYLIDDKYIVPVNAHKSDILQHYREGISEQLYDYVIYIFSEATENGKNKDIMDETKRVFFETIDDSGYELCMHIHAIKDYFLYALPVYAD